MARWPLIQCTFDHKVFWRAKRASNFLFLDFDVSNMPIMEFWVRLLETDYIFFHRAIEQDYF